MDVEWLKLGGDPALLTEGQGILTNTFEEFWYDEVELTFTPAPCHDPRMDADEDGDVDQEDFGFFQSCFTGPDPAPEAFDAATCHCMDANGDDDVDEDDYAVFEACASGPEVPANAACDD